MRINGELLEKYSECEDAEAVDRAQKEWFAQLDKEYTESRETKGTDLEEWGGGNLNRLPVPRKKDQDSDEGEDGDGEEEDEYQTQGERNLGMPSSDEDDEEEYQEYLRQKVLASKSFINPVSTKPMKPQAGVHEELSHSDDEYGSGQNGHDGVYNAVLVVVEEELGPSIIRPSNNRPDELSAVFSRTVISAPKRGLGS